MTEKSELTARSADTPATDAETARSADTPAADVADVESARIVERRGNGERAVAIYEDGREPVRLLPSDMAVMAGGLFPLAERVPGAEGEAFDWLAWHAAWRSLAGGGTAPAPTHLKVEAADAFEAVIPWEQLTDAAVLASVGGQPLSKGAPVRLYVPNGTSACLNVKSVVAFRLLRQPERGADAEYGFKNVFAPGELRKR